MAEFWDLIVKSNTFNFIVMLVIFAIIWQKANISEKIEKMRLEIADFIEKSKIEKENAEKELTLTKDSVANIAEIIEEKLSNAKVSAQNVFEEINNMAIVNVERIKSNVDKIIDNETRKINTKLSNETIDNAIQLAKSKLKEHFEQNPQLHEQYINENIETLDRINL